MGCSRSSAASKTCARLERSDVGGVGPAEAGLPQQALAPPPPSYLVQHALAWSQQQHHRDGRDGRVARLEDSHGLTRLACARASVACPAWLCCRSVEVLVERFCTFSHSSWSIAPRLESRAPLGLGLCSPPCGGGQQQVRGAWADPLLHTCSASPKLSTLSNTGTSFRGHFGRSGAPRAFAREVMNRGHRASGVRPPSAWPLHCVRDALVASPLLWLRGSLDLDAQPFFVLTTRKAARVSNTGQFGGWQPQAVDFLIGSSTQADSNVRTSATRARHARPCLGCVPGARSRRSL